MKLPFSSNPLHSRADVQRLVHDLVEPILPHFSEGYAQVHLGENRGHYGDPASWLEGFARPLWGLVPLAAGDASFDHWSLWQRGIASGTDPSHSEYWGMAGDYDQRSVEQGAFGLGLALAPEHLWNPLTPEVQKRFTAWLQRINKVQLVRSNWLFFRILVHLGLRRCGQPWSQKQIDSDFEQIDMFYLHNGWYSDGQGGAPYRDGRLGDYYVPMAFHFYGLVYAQLASISDPMRSATLKERAQLFAQDFQYYFSADGSALPFGRSLTYRFAQGAFWGALAFANVEALPWGVIKGLYLRHLRWWMRQPIFSETGLLTIGYTYPNLLMAESYNSAGSPYWSLKAFLPLALPEEHPFWLAEEAPLPLRPAVHTVPGANLVLVTDPRSRDVTAINPGQATLDWPRHVSHKYSKCAYSTRFGFSVPVGAPTALEGGLDNDFSVSDDGRFFRARELCLDPEVSDGVAYSHWQPWPDVRIETWLVADATGHIRIHRLLTKRPLWGREAGFALGWTRPDDVRYDQGIVRTSGGASALRDLWGQREPERINHGANSHLLSALSTMPILPSVHQPGAYWLVSRVSGSANPQEAFTDFQEFSVKANGEICSLFYKGNLWWERSDHPCGQSSPLRYQTLGIVT